ncbi:MAG: ABC transporter ATP-binding protein [Anaerolineae bacterium]|nr:ABC transporter ATP-binding protein [Thermoflexales bacterium]MDW8406679.1 ABC transporter ATP-binding protein [Anaerolineae bacterium]
MANDFAVELRDVVKLYGNMAAVDHVSMSIRHNEFFSLLGPSGCGKTTCLRIIAGFERPTSGQVLIDNKIMGLTPPFQRNVNTVFQSYALFPHMTVEQNVAFGLEMKGVSRAEINRRVGEALELVRLPHLAKRYPKQMSGGQQQRVALARALVNRPKVLLLDEPLGALDLKLRKEMQIELKTLQRDVGITFIYVTHDQEEALTMSDRIAVMSHGKALQIGSPLEIYERPTCKFVADFIGETNFLEGRVTAVNGEFATLTIRNGYVFTGRRVNGLQVGEVATLSVRPEKMQLVEHPVEGSANTYEVTVFSIAYVGSDTRVIINLGDQRLDVWEQNSTSTLNPDDYFFKPGEKAWLTFKPENALVLAQ